MYDAERHQTKISRHNRQLTRAFAVALSLSLATACLATQTVTRISPSSGLGTGGSFTVSVSDTSGWSNVSNYSRVALAFTDYRCEVEIFPASGWIYIFAADNSGWLGPFTSGIHSNATVSIAPYCQVDASGTYSNAGAGTATFALTFFLPAFQGTWGMIGAATDINYNTGWVGPFGSWTVQPPLLSDSLKDSAAWDGIWFLGTGIHQCCDPSNEYTDSSQVYLNYDYTNLQWQTNHPACPGTPLSAATPSSSCPYIVSNKVYTTGDSSHPVQYTVSLNESVNGTQFGQNYGVRYTGTNAAGASVTSSNCSDPHFSLDKSCEPCQADPWRCRATIQNE